MTYPNLKSIKDRFASILETTDTLPDLSLKKENIPVICKFLGVYLLKTLIICVLILIAWFLFTRLSVTYRDWTNSFRPAALRWHSPYSGATICNPPWLFPVLYPLALLSPPEGASLLFIISIIAIAMYVGSMKKTLIVASSAPMATLFVLGQIDALLLFGLMIPKGLGLPILLAKPQGVFLTVFQRLNRWSILVVSLTFVVSFFIWGDWWSNVLACQPSSGNVSLFPYTIVLGIILGYLGFKRKSEALLCVGSLCFSPYFMTHSILPAIAAIIRETEDWRWWVATVLGSWIYIAGMKGFLW